MTILFLLTLLSELGLSHDAVHQADGLHRVATLCRLYGKERRRKVNEMDEREVNINCATDDYCLGSEPPIYQNEFMHQ